MTVVLPEASLDQNTPLPVKKDKYLVVVVSLHRTIAVEETVMIASLPFVMTPFVKVTEVV